MVNNLGAQVYISTIRIPYWSWEDHPQYKGKHACLLFASGRSVLTTWRQSGYNVDLRVLNSPHLKLFHIPSPIALCHTNAPFSADRCQPLPCIPMMPTLMQNLMFQNVRPQRFNIHWKWFNLGPGRLFKTPTLEIHPFALGSLWKHVVKFGDVPDLIDLHHS